MPEQLHVELEPDHVRLEPGRAAATTVRVTNLGEIVEEYELSVLGVPPDVARVEPPRLSLLPEQQQEARVMLDDGAGRVAAGHQVVGVRVASTRRSQNVFVAELRLDVAAVDQLDLQVTPQTLRTGGSGALQAHVTNSGNRPVDVAFDGTDSEGAVSFTFAPARARVAPGDRLTSRVTVDARRPWTGAPRHRQLRIRAGGAEAHATFVQKARLAAGLLTALGVLFSLVVIGAIALCSDGVCLGTPATVIEEAGSDQVVPSEEPTEEPTEEPEPSPTVSSDPPSPEPEPAFVQIVQCQASPPASDPVPADAERIEETVGDLDGDELPDRLTTYAVRDAEGATTFYLRVETAIGFIGTQVLDQASGLSNVRPLGTHRIGEGPEVVFVQEETGASTALVSLWGLHADEDVGGCELRRITLPDPTAGLLFPVGGGISFGSGLECRDADGDDVAELWVWEAQAFESEGYVGRGAAWAWSGAGALTFVEATSQELEPLSDEQVERAFGLDCPGVRQ